MKTYKIGIFGVAHGHITALHRSFTQKTPDRVEFLGFTDYGPCFDPKLQADKMQKKLNDMPFYKNPEDLIALKPDIGLVCCDNAAHADVAITLMENGIIPIIEKPLADTMENALRIYEASRRTGVEFIVNWPVAWFPSFNVAQKMVQEGVVGKPLRFIYRTTATLGPHSYKKYPEFNEEQTLSWWYSSKRGGGSLLDYCCYGSVLAAYFLGRCADSVFGHKHRYMLPEEIGDVEDYAQLTMLFGEQTGYAEGSWSTLTTGGIPTGPIIFGTEGTLVCDRYHNVVKIYKERYAEEPDEVINPPEELDSLAENVIRHLDTGAALHPLINQQTNLWAMAALDAGKRSCESGKAEPTIKYEEIAK